VRNDGSAVLVYEGHDAVAGGATSVEGGLGVSEGIGYLLVDSQEGLDDEQVGRVLHTLRRLHGECQPPTADRGAGRPGLQRVGE